MIAHGAATLSAGSTTVLPASTISSRSVTAPLLFWLLLQLGVLALAAARIPLAARWPEPAEGMALHMMAVMQLTASGMLFPWLLRDRWCVLAHILSAGPMLQLASLLAGASTPEFLVTWACVAAWLGTLAVWRRSTSQRWLLHVVAGMNLIVLGGPLLVYLDAESSPPMGLLQYLPLLGVFRVIDGEPASFISMIFASLLAGLLFRRFNPSN